MSSELNAQTVCAARIENYLRDAVRLAREEYGPHMDFEACRWVLLALVETLGVPEELFYSAMDRMESWLEALDRLLQPPR